MFAEFEMIEFIAIHLSYDIFKLEIKETNHLYVYNENPVFRYHSNIII
jgi:hypothetical protein